MKTINLFIDEQQKKERGRARTLKRSFWWKNKLAQGKCYYCFKKIHPSQLTMEHIVPLCRGGKTTRKNVVASCMTCNKEKKYLLLNEVSF